MLKQEKMKIGIVGCGAIGTRIANAIDKEELKADLAGLCDIDENIAAALAGTLSKPTPILPVKDLVRAADLIVECAQVSAVMPVAELCIQNDTHLMSMSIGGVTEELFERFEQSRVNLYLPSGAICGLDGVLASNLEHIESIMLTTRKPPAGLIEAPYIRENNISLENLQQEKIVFEGSPAQAIKGFPKNINVSATLALAAAVDGRFKVRIIADPASTSNIHEVALNGPIGNIHIKVENTPSPDNPKTSALAYYSAIATLRKIISHVKIGT